MKPLGYVPRYDEMDVLAEIDIRGRFLKMSCDMEMTLLRIMSLCNPDPDSLRNFKGMTMGNKIEALICDLKNFKPAYFVEYEDELQKLWEFKVMRDDLAHHKIVFENFPPILKSFKVYLIDIQDGKEQLHYKEYFLTDVKDKILEYINLNATFEGLNQKLWKEYPTKNP